MIAAFSAGKCTARNLRVLLGTLGLLILATTSAAADCAWVLWEHTWKGTWWGWGPSRAEWTPLGAVATLQACEQEQARYMKMNDALAKVKGSPYVAWRCLPDTVDPRGPKGTTP